MNKLTLNFLILIVLLSFTFTFSTVIGNVKEFKERQMKNEPWSSSIKVFNFCDRTILTRTTIAGPIYADLALEINNSGYLSCEYVWYEVQVFSANTNEFLCTTGQPVNVYCGNAVVITGNRTVGYTCD
eukprot:TRINITY_DN396_c0_g1_i1.p1 TRINITY_DN396_c0_g1~~TRINITY_DN396_c0_g1_i1.p1  ORF type:complete len:128 (-),score=26.54 TRINITY_DN396_c0_g1_i1:104-487(-)